MYPCWRGQIEHGKMTLEDRAGFEQFVKTLDGVVEVVVKPWKRIRSDAQNRWYWACVVRLPAQHYGYEDWEMHEIFKNMFLQPQTKLFKGNMYQIRPSTAKTNTKEFVDYCDSIIRLCAEDGIIIPSPEHVDLNQNQ